MCRQKTNKVQPSDKIQYIKIKKTSKQTIKNKINIHKINKQKHI